MFTLTEIIDLAIRIEQNGAMAYKKARVAVSNPSLISLLHRLTEEEMEHEKWFTSLREEAGKSEGGPKLDEMSKAILQGVLGDRAFSMEETDFSKIEDVKSLLKLSVEFEKDTILFYQLLSAFIEEEKTLARLNQIVEEENRHVQVLEEFLQKEKGEKESV
ncbi:MAG: ferritin family protein [Syntrophales bacterium LBB04]|nr:ferritin family protein [Syntrophales bacterium LBB04]